MASSILSLPRAFCALAILLLVGPASAQESDNLNILSNFGRGDGESRTVFTLGTRAYYGIGNRLEISDFSTPASPTKLGSATLPGRLEDVVVVGNTAYVASGDGVHIFNVQNPTAVTELGSVAAESYGEGLAVDPPYILFADGDKGLRILDATDPANPTQVAQVDTLGYIEGISYGGDIVYMSAGSRIHMIDYSTPASPTYAGRIEDPVDWFQSATARGNTLFVADYYGGFHVYDVSTPASPQSIGYFDSGDRTARIALDGDYAYIANGDEGVRILNVATPANVTQAAVIDTPGRALQTQVSGTLVYVADSQGIQVYDITTPASPTFAGKVETQAPADGKAFGITVEGNYAYVAYGDAGLRILDASNPAALTQVSVLDVREGEEGAARQVVVSGDYAYVASRSAKVRVVDVSDPASPSIVSTLDVAGAGDVSLDGTLLAVAGDAGVTVFDITNPAAPSQLFASSDLGYADRVGVFGDYVYAITTGSNVRVFDATTPSAITLAGTVATGGDYSEGRITVIDDKLYTTNGDLLIVDVSTKTAPAVLGTFDAPSYSYSAGAEGIYAYVATEREGIRLVDVSTPASPTEVGFAKPGEEMRDVAVRNGLVFAANGDGGVTVMQNTLFVAAEDGPNRSGDLALLPTAPNPVPATTDIRFELATAADVTVEVFNVLGQRVATVVDAHLQAGAHSETFDASRLAVGTYIVRVQSGRDHVSVRMVVAR